MLNRRIGLIGIPYNVGSRGKCLQKGAEALRKAGIVEALRRVRKITDFGNICVSLPPPDYRNPSLLNPNQVETLCRAVAERIKIVLEADCLPFIIGGDCSVLMGIVQGLKGLAPRLGIVYMDAHGDFNTPETTPSGTIGGMDVAIVAARGPKVLTEMFGHAPLLAEWNIVLYGVRDLDPLEAKALAKSELKVYTRETIRVKGAENATKEVLDYLRSRCDCIYLHVDLDVLDASVISATGLPVADGLIAEEFHAALSLLAKSADLCCVTITSFDAARDCDGTQAKRISKLIVEALFG